MFKVSFTTMATPNQNGIEAVRIARKLGYQGVDIRLSEYSGELKLDSSREEIAALRSAFISEEIEPSSLLCYNETATDAPHSWQKMIDSILYHAEMANKIGALSVRIRCGDPAKSDNPADFIKKTAEALSTILDRDKSGINYVIQNHTGKYLTLDSVKLINRVNNPRFRLAFSPDNCIASEEDMDEVYKAVSAVTGQIYISDLKRTSEGYSEVLPGMGIVPVKDSFNAIGGVKFHGWVTFKYGKVWNDSLEEPEKTLPYFINKYKIILDL